VVLLRGILSTTTTVGIIIAMIAGASVAGERVGEEEGRLFVLLVGTTVGTTVTKDEAIGPSVGEGEVTLDCRPARYEI
jgi:uncharacterized membrane protein (DUF441 family)